MDAVEVLLLVEELIAFHVPRVVAGVGLDLEVLHRCDEPLVALVKVATILERQFRSCLSKNLERVRRRWFALWVEVPLWRDLWCCVASSFNGEVATDTKSGTGNGNRLQKLSSCGHVYLYVGAAGREGVAGRQARIGLSIPCGCGSCGTNFASGVQLRMSPELSRLAMPASACQSWIWYSVRVVDKAVTLREEAPVRQHARAQGWRRFEFSSGRFASACCSESRRVGRPSAPRNIPRPCERG